MEGRCKGLPKRRIHLVQGAVNAEVLQACHAMSGDAAGYDTGEMGQIGGDVERYPMIAHPAANAHADGGDLVFAAVVANHPDADSAGPSFAVHAQCSQCRDQPGFQVTHKGPDIGVAPLQIEHDIGNPLAGAMIGILAATSRAVDWKARRIEQVGVAGGGSCRIQGRMFQQPDGFRLAAGPDGGDAAFHFRHGLWIGHGRMANQPGNTVHIVRLHGPAPYLAIVLGICYVPRQGNDNFRRCGKGLSGRGGTGRRAALRSLWGKPRGSSSLLDRTKIPKPVASAAGFSALWGWRRSGPSWMDRRHAAFREYASVSEAPLSSQPSSDGDLLHQLEADRIESILDALHGGQEARVRGLVTLLHAADIADIFERLSPADRERLIDVVGRHLPPDVLSELDETVREDIIERLGAKEVAAVVAELDSDDAVQVIEELDEPERREILDAMPVADRALIEEALTFPEDSAGRLMQREVVTVAAYWTVGQTIDFLRQSAEEDADRLPETFYDIVVVDAMFRPVGTIPLSHLLRSRRPVCVTDIMSTDMHVIPAIMDQEDIAFLFRQRDLVSAPVINESGRLVGIITIDDVVDVMQEEHEEDIMLLGGVQESDFYSAALQTTGLRFKWLAVNLFTASLGAMVINLFSETIAQVVALAVLMPIVASMGGNAGTQTLTVTVRALATKELTPTNALRLVGKETLVGGLNGVLLAILTGLVAWLWSGNPSIAMAIAMAMVANLVIAGLAGITIPLALERMGADPAVASSVFLTAVTDVVGFFTFLGLATLIVL